MVPKFEADPAFMDRLKGGPLERADRRERRNAVEQLLWFQHMLPWDSSKRTQFFYEVPEDGGALSDKEHALRISQLKSLILMAWDGRHGNEGLKEPADNKAHLAEAERRLLLAWFCPTVRCTNRAHRALSRG